MSSSAPTDLPPETSTRLIQSLDSWNFEPHKLSDEEVLSCTMILFEALFRIEGMKSVIGVSLGALVVRRRSFSAHQDILRCWMSCNPRS